MAKLTPTQNVGVNWIATSYTFSHTDFFPFYPWSYWDFHGGLCMQIRILTSVASHRLCTFSKPEFEEPDGLSLRAGVSSWLFDTLGVKLLITRINYSAGRSRLILVYRFSRLVSPAKEKFFVQITILIRISSKNKNIFVLSQCLNSRSSKQVEKYQNWNT